MTIKEAIDLINESKPNQISTKQKVFWLSQLDWRVYRELILTHYDEEAEEYKGYTQDTDQDTRLRIDDAYASVYKWWLSAQIDLDNMELVKYNNSISLFNAEYDSYAKWYHGTHMPAQKKFHL